MVSSTIFSNLRGAPYAFLQLVAHIGEQTNGQLISKSNLLQSISEIAEKLLENVRTSLCIDSEIVVHLAVIFITAV